MLIIKLQKSMAQSSGRADRSNVAYVVWSGEEYGYYAIVMLKYYMDFFFTINGRRLDGNV